jgi:DNA-binding response OmpR family regulator
MKRVLVVEDDGEIRRLLADLISHEGYVVDQARQGNEALAAMARHRPDLIVLDLMMPIMDGWDFLEKCPAGIPIVVVSALDEVHNAKAHPDVRAVLQKPVRMDALADAVRPFLT